MLEFRGRVGPVRSQPLFFRSGGRVERLSVRIGEDVKAGQILAELDTERLVREVSAAELRLQRAQDRQLTAQAGTDRQTRRAQLQLDIARLNLEAVRAVKAPDKYQVAILERQVALAEITLEEAASPADPSIATDVAQAELDLDRAQAELAAARIVAPFDGRVLEVAVGEGRAVEAFKPLLTIGDVRQLEVVADLQSEQLVELAPGMPAQVAIVGQRGGPYPAKIRQLPGRLDQLGADADRTTRVRLDEAAAGLELGQTVRVVAELERKEDTLWLPPQAVRTFEGRAFALVQDGAAQRRVDVTVGIRGPERVEIVAGLEEGQMVLAP
jgi:RND family efflux transporter MFP subunit